MAYSNNAVIIACRRRWARLITPHAERGYRVYVYYYTLYYAFRYIFKLHRDENQLCSEFLDGIYRAFEHQTIVIHLSNVSSNSVLQNLG